jgi:hypothetical protein
MSSTPYAQFHGIDISGELEIDTLSSGGGNRKVDSYSLPGWQKAEVSDEGRDATTYSGDFSSYTLADIQAIVSEFNRSPEDVEFYPFDSDYHLYAATASARYGSSIKCVHNGVSSNLYQGNFEITCREPFKFGVRQGLLHDSDVTLPATSSSITALGDDGNTINYLMMSGDYDSGYTKKVYLTVNKPWLLLINQLMAGDCFELSRWGEVCHSYTVNWRTLATFAELQTDLWGSGFCTGGVLGDDLLTFTNGHIMFPFSGPLPCADSPPPNLKFVLNSGAPTVWRSFESDLSDKEEVDIDLKAGYNSIEIPGCDGHSFVSIGLYGTFSVSDLYAEVHRYLAEAELPVVNSGDSFTISVTDGVTSNHSLRHLTADYCNKFWW